jgi:hypothetical protein
VNVTHRDHVAGNTPDEVAHLHKLVTAAPEK